MKWLFRFVTTVVAFVLIGYLVRPVDGAFIDGEPSLAASIAVPALADGELAVIEPTDGSRVKGRLRSRHRRARARLFFAGGDRRQEVPLRYLGNESIVSEQATEPVKHPIDLIGWEPDGSYYLATLVDSGDRDLYFGTIEATRPTGLSIGLTGLDTLDAGWQLRLARTEGRGADPRFAALLELMGDGRDAIYRQGVPLTATMICAPLYPDPTVRLVVISPDGVPVEDREIVLLPERIRSITLDLTTSGERSGRAEELTLLGKLVLPPGLDPIDTVIRRRGMRGKTWLVAADGSFSIKALPREEPSRFVVETRGPDDRAETHGFLFDPDHLPEDSAEAYVTWRVLPGDGVSTADHR